MKKLFLLFTIIAFTNILGVAQDIPAKTNTIVITLSDSLKMNEKVSKVFTSKDYTINAGKNPNIIATGAKTLKNNTRVSMNAQIKGAEIVLTGKIVVAGQGNINIEYKGTKGTPIMIAWEELDKIAKAFGGKVKYEVR
jgi:hypothetical protein